MNYTLFALMIVQDTEHVEMEGCVRVNKGFGGRGCNRVISSPRTGCPNQCSGHGVCRHPPPALVFMMSRN